MNNINYEGLREDEIESWEASEISKIYPKLLGGLFHRTNIEGYRGIRKHGRILPNQGQFPFTYPQSKISLAFSKGYTSLFDFGSVRDRDCISNHHNWGGFFFDQKPITIILCLNRGALSKKLIASSSVPKLGEPGYIFRIPYVEAWYPEPIPFGAIDGVIFTIHHGFGEGPLLFEFAKREMDLFEKIIDEIQNAWNDFLDEPE